LVYLFGFQMRLIGDLSNSQQAETFAAFLLVKGIETQVDADDAQIEIWAKDEDRFEEALGDFKEFQQNPSDAKYVSSVQQAKAIVREEDKKRQKIQKNIVKVSGGNLPRRRRWTVILIGACAMVALATEFGESGVSQTHKVYQALQFVYVPAPASLELIKNAEKNAANLPDSLSLRFASLKRGEVWRLVTTIFIHLGVFHLLFNMYWLFLFGTMIEHRYGSLKFMGLVLVSAAISNSFQWGVPVALGGASPGYYPESGILISGGGGMSGVVYALLGYIWMKSLYDRSSGFSLPQSTIIILIGWLFFCMLPMDMRAKIGFGSAVGNWAHAVGLLVGMGIGYATSMMKSK
jgi:GlpG protein